jgi:hypothetical protein
MNFSNSQLDDIWDDNFKNYFSTEEIPGYSYYSYKSCPAENLPLPSQRLDPRAIQIQKIMNDPALSDAAKAAKIAAILGAQTYAGTGPVIPPPPPVINPNRPPAAGGGPIMFPDSSSSPVGNAAGGVAIIIDENGVRGAIIINPQATAEEIARLIPKPQAPPAGSENCQAGGGSTGGTNPSNPTGTTPSQGGGGTPINSGRPSGGGGGNNQGGGGGGRNPRGNGVAPGPSP